MLFSPLLVIYTTRPPYYLSRAIGKQQKKSLDSVSDWEKVRHNSLYAIWFKFNTYLMTCLIFSNVHNKIRCYL
uniref:Uncharacterized protein n=1 Tax=Heterorhabditis bacteriophora TaxID=37862 RepID=A0A1I7WB58_HETBA